MTSSSALVTMPQSPTTAPDGIKHVVSTRPTVTPAEVRELRAGFKFEYPVDLTEMIRTDSWGSKTRKLYHMYHRKQLDEYMYRGLLELFGKSCAVCGREEHVEWAHLRATKLNGDARGVTSRRRDIEKNPDCYIRLCEECNDRFDMRLMTINGILSTTPVANFRRRSYDYQDQVAQQQREQNANENWQG